MKSYIEKTILFCVCKSWYLAEGPIRELAFSRLLSNTVSFWMMFWKGNYYMQKFSVHSFAVVIEYSFMWSTANVKMIFVIAF